MDKRKDANNKESKMLWFSFALMAVIVVGISIQSESDPPIGGEIVLMRIAPFMSAEKAESVGLF